MRAIRRLSGPVVVAAMMACTCLASASEVAASKRPRPHEGAEPDQVSFIVYVLDVDEISGEDQSFIVNMTLVLMWKDERLAHTGGVALTMPLEEVWNPRVLVANRQTLMRSPLPEVVEVEPNGTVTYRQQYVGPLSQKLDLRDFPLDTQDFNIHFVAVGHRPEDLEFVPAVMPGAEQLVGGGIADTLSLPDWEILGSKAESRPYVVTDALQVPGFAFEFTAKRYFAYYVWQVMMPLALIVMMSWAPFWIDPTKAELQAGVAASAVLTVIAHRFILANLLPKLPYLTRMDYLTLSGTVLVFLAFLQMILTSHLACSNRIPLAERIDRWCRAVFPMAFLGAVVWSLFL